MGISIPLLTSEGGVTIGKKDMGTKNLMNYPDVFADIGNVNLFCGETVRKRSKTRRSDFLPYVC